METKKEFDCVELKNEIQKKIMEDYQLVNDIEKHRTILKKLRANNKLSKFLSKDSVDIE